MNKGKIYLGGILMMALGALILNLVLAGTGRAQAAPQEIPRYELIVKERVHAPKQVEPYVILTHFIWVDRATGTAKVFYWDQIKNEFVRWRKPVPSFKD